MKIAVGCGLAAAGEFADTRMRDDSDPDLVSGVKNIRRENNDF